MNDKIKRKLKIFVNIKDVLIYETLQFVKVSLLKNN